MLRHSSEEGLVVNKSVHRVHVDHIPNRELGHEVGAAGNPVITKTFGASGARFPVTSETAGDLLIAQTTLQTAEEIARRSEDRHGWIICEFLGNEHGRINAETTQALVQAVSSERGTTAVLEFTYVDNSHMGHSLPSHPSTHAIHCPSSIRWGSIWCMPSAFQPASLAVNNGFPGLSRSQ